jgi:ribonuclease HII
MLRNNPNHEEIFVGVDECGRGPLAGPVVAAAVIWNPDLVHENNHLIRDSKKLTKKQREMLTDFIKDNAIDYSIAFVDNHVIDKINILNATHKAMHDALSGLRVDFDHILVDGNSFPCYKGKNHTCVVKGDNTFLSIAAASIIAKTTRDKYMEDLSKMFPEYKWGKNSGYGTKEHLEAIKEYGITDYHRTSFSPCSSFSNDVYIEDSDTNSF